MLPYIEITTLSFGPITIQFWGLMVALGIIASIIIARYEAQKRNLRINKFFDLFFWIILASLIGARLFHVVFYEWSYYMDHFFDIFKIWQGGMSVFGGIAGAFIIGIIFIRKYNLDFWQWADTIIFSLPLGLFIGRIGCTFIHDHPGILTNSFLGVAYPDGARFDLGLMLSINGLILFLVFLWMHRRERFTGFYLSIFFIWYGAVRIALDFFRAWDLPNADIRLLYLTPAQYFSLIMIAIGFYLYLKRSKLSRV